MTLVGEEIELEDNNNKWNATMAAPNGSVYGIPFGAPRVAKFNPIPSTNHSLKSDLTLVMDGSGISVP